MDSVGANFQLSALAPFEIFDVVGSFAGEDDSEDAFDDLGAGKTGFFFEEGGGIYPGTVGSLQPFIVGSSAAL